MHPLLCSLQNVIYWGTSAAFLPDSLPYLIALPVPVSPHMYVYIIIYIYIYFAQVWVLFLPRSWHSLSTVCVIMLGGVTAWN